MNRTVKSSNESPEVTPTEHTVIKVSDINCVKLNWTDSPLISSEEASVDINQNVESNSCPGSW